MYGATQATASSLRVDLCFIYHAKTVPLYATYHGGIAALGYKPQNLPPLTFSPKHRLSKPCLCRTVVVSSTRP